MMLPSTYSETPNTLCCLVVVLCGPHHCRFSAPLRTNILGLKWINQKSFLQSSYNMLVKQRKRVFV